jgi:hypothetical protein
MSLSRRRLSNERRPGPRGRRRPVDDVEAFDAWRIRFFLDEDAEARPSIEELRVACSYLASLGELREVTAGRWYALPDH